MKDDYVFNFQTVKKHDQQNDRESADRITKTSIFMLGGYEELCIDLRFENYQVEAIDEIDEAVAKLQEYALIKSSLPDVIIIHKKIDLNSVDALCSLKRHNALREIPIILITKYFSEAERDLAMRIGVEDYYTENISAKFLSFRIDFLKRLRLLAKESQEEVGFQPTSSLHNSATFEMWSMKRAFDVLIAGIALLLISPLLLVIAVAIKLDSKGPVFYVSKRAGKGYEIFNFYKFRSMREDADKIVEELKHLNQYNGNSEKNGMFFKVKNDPRVTKMGSFLRKTSLDELPQLYNVLKGDMSLVGNRPLPLYEAEQLTQDQWALRFLAPAGITGLWQITKRGKAEMSESERVELDMEYARKNSFLYDLKIILKTPMALLQKEEV